MTRPADPPIDALVTWVDGSDPAHRARLNAHLEGLGRRPAIASEARYRETGEFAYCIASLLRFAPWLRRIHIVADGQEPAFMPRLRELGLGERVVLVDHGELFRGHEQALPTFNIRAIKSMFWNIEGLAERFIFLNDDFLLLRPVQSTDFFRDGAPVLAGGWRPQPPRARGDARPGNHRAQAAAARLAGYRWRYFKVPHKPHPLLKSTLRDYMQAHPEQLEHNIGFRLRDDRQFLADALVNHLLLRRGQARVDNRLKTLRCKPDDYRDGRLQRLLGRAERDERLRFACLQSLETLPEALRPTLFGWLDARIGEPDRVFRGEGLAA